MNGKPTTWIQTSTNTATDTLYIDVYKRASGGAETLLFSFGNQVISGGGTGIQSLTVESVQPAISLLVTDRLVIKYSASTSHGASVTITLYGGGSTNYSHVHTPIGSISSGVTSVALAVPARQTVTGSPVTTTGMFTISDNAQNSNYVFAGPATTSPPTSTPTFRALVSADLPTSHFFGEIPSGTAPTTTYTLSHTPLVVFGIFYNGQFLVPGSLSPPTNDYSISGTTITLNFTTSTESVVYAFYLY